MMLKALMHNIQDVFYRFVRYYREHGMMDTIKQLFIVGSRTFMNHRYHLFYVELPLLTADSDKLPAGYAIECRMNESSISDREIKELVFQRGEQFAQSNIKDRYAKGAVLWLIKVNGDSAGFVWSVKKSPMKPYFFPLLEYDVHLFDNEIFKEYRGKALNSLLINHVLLQLKNMGHYHAYIETRSWNEPEIRSLKKTFFQPLAKVTQVRLFGMNIVKWQ